MISGLENNEIQESSFSPLFRVNIQMTEDEIVTCLKKTSRRSKKLSWFQTILLLLVIFNCIFGFITDVRKTTSTLWIGVAALAVIGVIWIFPPLYHRHIAREELRTDPIDLCMKVYDDQVVFGEETEKSYEYGECKPILCDNLIVLSIGTQVIGVPRRLLKEDEWNLLLNKFQLQTKEAI